MASFQPAYIRAFEEGLLRQKAEKARRGLLIRHLVLPGGLAGTRQIMRFTARSISTGSYVNVMSQYRPCGRAGEVDGLGESLSPVEYHLAVRMAKQEGVTWLDDPRACVCDSMKKIFAIGDIHGCDERLHILMEKIPVDFSRDTLVFIGDYIDRGPNSIGVVDYLVDLKKRVPGIVCLKGNHEDMLEKYLDGTDRFTYLLNGGQQTLDSYLRQPVHSGPYPIPPDHLQFFKSLRLYYETDEYIFVHAGLRPRVPLEAQETEDLLWIRDKFIHSKYDFSKRVVFGHTPLSKPLVEPNKIGIDTGAVYGKELTCVQLPDLEFFTA